MADGTLFEGVGWSSSLPPNAAAFMDQPDPSLPPAALRTPDDPHVAALRAELRENSGMQSLEICRPDEVERAVELLRRDGVAVVADALSPSQLHDLREAADRVMRTIVETDPACRGTNGPHRYSYGASSLTRHMMHEPAWRALIDLPTTQPILERMWGSPNFICAGGGGEVVLPGALEFQSLHSVRLPPPPRSHFQPCAVAKLSHMRCLLL